MRRLKLGIDIDEVVCDFVTPFHTEAERVLGRSLPHLSYDWGFKDWGLSKSDVHRVWDRITESEDWFYTNVKPFAGVQEVLAALHEHDLFFITSRVETKGMPVSKQSLLTLTELGLVNPTVLVLHDKGPIAAALELDYFIDDKPANLQRVAQSHISARLFLMNHTQNASFKEPADWTRVTSLAEFKEKL